MKEDETGKVDLDLAVQIHREVGPGLLETVYVEGLSLTESAAIGAKANRLDGSCR